MAELTKQITENLEAIGWGKYQQRTFFVCGLCWCNMLLWSACISISLKETSAIWNLSNIQLGAIGSSHNIGILIGCYFWGYIGNNYGRLIGLKSVFVLNAIFGVLYTCAIDFYMLCISSAIVGFCGGGAKVLSGALYLETLCKKQQWTLVLLTVFISLGGILAYSFAVIILAGGTHSINLWRWVGGFDIIIMIITTFLLFTIFESPKFLVSQNKEEQANIILVKIARINGKQVKVDLESPSKHISINNDSIIGKSKSGKLSEIFEKSILKQTIIFTVCMFLSDFSYSGLLVFMPIILSRSNSHISSQIGIYSTIVGQILVGMPGSFVSSFLVNRGYQKRWLVVAGFIFCGLSVFFFLLAYQYWMVFLAICLNYFFNNIGYSSIIALITESYNVRIRSLGVGWANGWSNVGGAISPLLLGIVFEIEGDILLGVFLLSVAFGIVGVLALFLTEPKDLKLLDN